MLGNHLRGDALDALSAGVATDIAQPTHLCGQCGHACKNERFVLLNRRDCLLQPLPQISAHSDAYRGLTVVSARVVLPRLPSALHFALAVL